MKEKLFRKYMNTVHPKISGLRGSYRLRVLLEKIALRDIPRAEKNPKSVFDNSWDNLLILDACRHDLYEEIKGKTKSRISKASSTPGFISENFSERDFSDVVYVTGNPHFSQSKFKEITGRDVNDVFHEVFHTYSTDWDEKEGTVLPEPLIRDAKTAKKLFPNKRLIVHFMQPHYPFVNSDTTKEGIRKDLDGEKTGLSVWEEAERGKHSSNEVWNAYKKCLKFILDEIFELPRELGDKTVVTSDHGNLVGEKGFYGHSLNYPAKALRKVPWDVIEDEND